jgi:hypothetical protein
MDLNNTQAGADKIVFLSVWRMKPIWKLPTHHPIHNLRFETSNFPVRQRIGSSNTSSSLSLVNAETSFLELLSCTSCSIPMPQDLAGIREFTDSVTN